MISRIDIKDIQGNILLSVSLSESCERVEELMKADYVQLEWNSDSCAILPVGTYIDYKGEKYSLLDPYMPEQKSELEFTYTPQFQSKIMLWGKTPFFMYTYTDNKVTNKEPDWSLTDNPGNFMSRIVDAIKNETGEVWTYTVDASLPASATLNFQSVDVFSALNEIANAFETEWWVDKATKVLYLSKASHGTAVTLEVGRNINTPSVTNGKEGYYTRFYAFGSTRNITQDYKGSNTNNIVNKRLTLDPAKYPNGYKDIRPDLKDGEIFSKVLIFDEIYPSSKLAISDVRSRLMYRLDEKGNKIQVGIKDGSPVYDQYTIWYFQIPGYTFNKEDIIDGKTLSVHFESGSLSGREFELVYHDTAKKETSSDGLAFQVKAGDYEIKFIEEDSLILPMMTGLVPADTDKVILFNIKMPAEYTASAYVDLEAELDKEIERLSSDLNNYQFDSNRVEFYNNNPGLSIGRNVTYRNGTYSYSTRVIKLVTKIDYENDCNQSITIGNEKVKGNTQELKEEVASANKDLNLLSVFNDMTASLQQSYSRTQQMMLDGFAAIKNIWQLKEDEQGNKYALSKYSVVTEKDIVIHAKDPDLKVPTILDSIPLGNGLAIVDGKLTVTEIGGIDTEAIWSALGASTNEQINKSHLTNALSGYATQTWVKNQGYLTQHQSLEGYATQTWVNTQITNNAYTLPVASSSVLGGVKIGDNISITDGVISTHSPYQLTKEKILSVLKDANGIIELDASLVLSGDFAIYSAKKLNAPSIMDSLVLDPNTLAIVDGALTVVGGTGGIDETELASYLTEHNYYHSGNINVMTTDTNQQVTGRKDFYNSIYLYGSKALNSQTQDSNNNPVMRNLMMTDSSLNNVLSDVKNPTILRGSQIKFQNVNGTDLINIYGNQTNFYTHAINRSGNFIESEGWFQNDYNGRGLYNSVGNAHFYYESTFGGFKSDKPLYATEKMQVGNDIVLHAGNYNSYALPLSGGTVTGITQFNNLIKAYRYGTANNLPAITLDKPGSYAYGIGADGTNMRVRYGCVNNMDGTSWIDENNLVHYFVGNSIRLNNYEVWHAGNMGAGSGLNADTLDGYHRSNIFPQGTWDFLIYGTGGACQKSIVVNGDKDTYYPVVISVMNDDNWIDNIITISKVLGSQTPAWAGNHGNGTSSGIFSFHYRIGIWDGNGHFLNTIRKTMPYANWLGHLEFASSSVGKAVVWLRGGGAQYTINCNNGISEANIYYSRTNLKDNTYPAWVEPKTSGNYGYYASGAANPCFTSVNFYNENYYINGDGFKIGLFEAASQDFKIRDKRALVGATDILYINYGNDWSNVQINGITNFNQAIFPNDRVSIGGNDFWGTARLTIASTNYPLAFYNPNGTANSRKYYWSIGSDYMTFNALNDGNGWVRTLMTFYHNGRIEVGSNLQIQGNVCKFGYNGTSYIQNNNSNQVLAFTNDNNIFLGSAGIRQINIETSGGYAQQISGLDTTFNGTVKTHQYSTQYFSAFMSENTAITGTDPDYRWTIYHAKSNVRRGLSFWSYDANSTVFNEVMTLSSYGGNQLYVNGTIVMTGDFVIYKTSDRRLKENLRRFNAHSLITKLGGVYKYDYTDEALSLNPSLRKHSIGLIAQNVEKVFPWMVHEHDGYKSVNYYDTQFISLLAACEIQTISKLSMLERWKNKEEREINRLKKENINLRKRVSVLEGMVNDKTIM